jgi:hypothetical protein
MPIIPKYFNVAGPCIPDRHYMLPAIARLPEARELAERGQYFVIHAARQSGKTTLLRALTREINAEGQYYALYCSLEALQGIDDLDRGLPMIVDEVNAAVAQSPALEKTRLEPQSAGNVATGVRLALSNIASSLDRPLVLFLDEADCLSGQPLITFLRQLRNGYINRAKAPFPWSIALVGMRDIRDFKAQVRTEGETLGSASPFNVVTEALTLANFTREQVAELYRQHTEATGQAFEPEAVDRAWYWSEGQPWLANALARQVVEDDLHNDYSMPVTASRIDSAADALMKRRDTHIDSLLDRLKEPTKAIRDFSHLSRTHSPMLTTKRRILRRREGTGCLFSGRPWGIMRLPGSRSLPSGRIRGGARYESSHANHAKAFQCRRSLHTGSTLHATSCQSSAGGASTG